jgi:predicted transcriptional regulator
MSRRPALARSELEVARIVWKLGNATVRQVLESLPSERDLDFKTVQTYLRRLEAKGYLRARSKGRTKVYTPRVRPKQVVGEVIDDLMDRLFDGEVLPLLQHVIHDRGLSEDEIHGLRELLARLEDEDDEPGAK